LGWEFVTLERVVQGTSRITIKLNDGEERRKKMAEWRFAWGLVNKTKFRTDIHPRVRWRKQSEEKGTEQREDKRNA